jgi:hypothetical protein
MSKAQYEVVARSAAQKHGVPVEMFLRQITQESGWNPSAVSPAGAKGIAQFMPGTARDLGVDPMDPLASLDAAARYDRQLYAAHDQRWRRALAAYNWGWGNVAGTDTRRRWDGRRETLPDETAHYLDVILGPRWPEPQESGGTGLPMQYCFPVENYPKGPIPLHWGTSPNAADLFAAKGTPIRAMVSGVIDDASWNDVGGWSVYLIGDPDTKSLHYYLAHLHQKPLVVKGQRVVAGQTIGGVGDTGNAKGTGAHLHIGIGKSIKNGADAEGGAGVPWPGNNCNKYLQHVLDTLGSAPVDDPETEPEPVNYETVARYLTAQDGPVLGALRDRVDRLNGEAKEVQNVIDEIIRNRPS